MDKQDTQTRQQPVELDDGTYVFIMDVALVRASFLWELTRQISAREQLSKRMSGELHKKILAEQVTELQNIITKLGFEHA